MSKWAYYGCFIDPLLADTPQNVLKSIRNQKNKCLLRAERAKKRIKKRTPRCPPETSCSSNGEDLHPRTFFHSSSIITRADDKVPNIATSTPGASSKRADHNPLERTGARTPWFTMTELHKKLGDHLNNYTLIPGIDKGSKSFRLSPFSFISKAKTGSSALKHRKSANFSHFHGSVRKQWIKHGVPIPLLDSHGDKSTMSSDKAQLYSYCLWIELKYFSLGERMPLDSNLYTPPTAIKLWRENSDKIIRKVTHFRMDILYQVLQATELVTVILVCVCNPLIQCIDQRQLFWLDLSSNKLVAPLMKLTLCWTRWTRSSLHGVLRPQCSSTVQTGRFRRWSAACNASVSGTAKRFAPSSASIRSVTSCSLTQAWTVKSIAIRNHIITCRIVF